MAGKWSVWTRVALFVVMVGVSGHAVAAEPDGTTDGNARIERLEKTVLALTAELQQLRKDRDKDKQSNEQLLTAVSEMRKDVEENRKDNWLDAADWIKKFTFGGYGEMHANFGESGSSDVFDLHRLVAYVGYEFNDWISFHSEIEIEHAFVSDDSGGYVAVEQAYFDFLLCEPFNIRAGRILTPLGIINKKHEPPTFFGVERPSFSKYIIPTTWPSDGIGIFGQLADCMSYELYVVGGLDGTGFSAKNGIRGGRITERPSLNEPAVTGRVDFMPFAGKEMPCDQDLRIGLSTYFGGLDNGNKGSNPGIDGRIHIYSADFEYSVGKFDFRGAAAFEQIDGAREIGNGTAEGIFGWYLEGGYHFLPESCKTGKLKGADAVVFVRYDRFDTQHKMPSGVAGSGAGDRHEWTFGVNFYLTKNVVLKADYQILSDDSGSDPPNKFNLGLGWQF